jgi:SAM-dependent methyltransferase
VGLSLDRQLLTPRRDVRLRAALRRLARFLFGRDDASGARSQSDYVEYRGSLLPPASIRMGGRPYEDDAFFFESAMQEAERVVTDLSCGPDDVFVDIGCGQGRLAIGLVKRLDHLAYLGLDVSSESIAWCDRYITGRHPSYRFRYLDVVNARYNPTGSPIAEDFRFPVDTGSVDIVYMWGVVTNMEPEHLEAYAREIHRILRPGGRAFLTAHVEDNVPRVSLNPPNYAPYRCKGPLHCVRYERGYFLDVMRQAGLQLTRSQYHGAGNCQTDLYFSKG